MALTLGEVREIVLACCFPLADNTQPVPATRRLPYATTGAPQPPSKPLHRPPADILSQVPWVNIALIQSISVGNFDIFNLPKLHRDNSVRRKHVARSVEGILLSTGNTPQLEIVNGTTRLHTYFNEIGSFYSAWLVYITIRTHFYPERAHGGCQRPKSELRRQKKTPKKHTTRFKKPQTR